MNENDIIDAKRKIDEYHAASANAAKRVAEEIRGIYEQSTHELIDNQRAMNSQIVVLTKSIKELQNQFDQIAGRNDNVIGIIQKAHQDTAERAYENLVDEHNHQIATIQAKFDEFVSKINKELDGALILLKKGVEILTAESLPTTQVKIQYLSLGVVVSMIGMGIFSIFT